METLPVEIPEQVLMLRRGSRSPTPTPEEQEKRALLLKNDLLLHEAVIKNDPDAVKKILKEPLDINSRNNYGRAPIHWAASRGSTDIMEMLISANCDIEARDKYGMRPLLMSAWHGHKDAVQVLVNAGASTNSVNKKQYSLLTCAAHNNRLSVVNYLLDQLEDVKVDSIDGDGQTALHHSACGGHVQVVKRLVEAGADPDYRDKESRTALHSACEHGHLDVVEFLLTHEANIEANDNSNNTPLHLAAEHQQTSVVQLLLDHGANPDAENNKGFTPLHIASNLGSRGIIEALVQHGGCLNKQSKNGSTPLHLACQANETDTVELLIGKGADFNSLNNEDQRNDAKRKNSTKPVLNTARRKLRLKGENGQSDCGTELENNERLRQVLYKLAYKQLESGEWKRLAYHWAFTDEQIKAIEHQYTGPASYKEHGFRMLLIWVHGLASDVNPIKELCESLTAIDKKAVADALRRKIDQENEERSKGHKGKCGNCSIT